MAGILSSQVTQNIQQRQSQFTAEVHHIARLLDSLESTAPHQPTLVYSDQMVISTSHEENVALNLAFLEAFENHPGCHCIIGTLQPDTLQYSPTRYHSVHNAILSLPHSDLQQVATAANDADFVEHMLQIGMPTQYCMHFKSLLWE